MFPPVSIPGLLPAVSPPPVPPAGVAPADTHWWEVLSALGPLAVLTAALLTFALGWKTLNQRRRADAAALAQRREADQRSEWWARAQWAIESSLSEDPRRQETGLGVLNLLAQSELAGEEEIAIISIAWAEPLGVLMDSDGNLGQNEGGYSPPAEEADA